MTTQGFLELGVSARVLRAIEAMGFEEPTPVQSQVIPKLLGGADLIVQAQTGTGKTAAFGIPIAETVDPLVPRVQALVLSPTRELALQVSVHLNQIGQFLGLNVLPVYGGQSYDHQLRALRRGVQVVVATPGRLLDLLDRRAFTADDIRLVVLDEADEMLAMGFQEDVERILSLVPETRQTALFSATMPQAILRLAAAHQRQPERVVLTQSHTVTAPRVEQSYYMVPRPFKTEALTQLLDMASPKLALVFSATKQMAADLAAELQGSGYRAEALHGDMTQVQRENVMEAGRRGRLDVLVATDVAARGLDIPEVSHVYNFDIPQDPDRYVHRIGRTARAGRAGEAITLIIPREMSLLRSIERTIGGRIQRRELPTVAEIEAKELANMAAQLERLLIEGDWASFRPLVEGLAELHDPIDLAAAALSKAFGPVKKRRRVPKVTDDERRPNRAAPPSYGKAAPRTFRNAPPPKKHRS